MAKNKSPAFSLWVVVVVLGGFLVEEAHGESPPSHEGKARPPVVELPGDTLAFGPAKTPSHKGKPRPPVVELPGDTLGFGPAKTPSHKGKPRPPVVELPGDTLRFGPATTPSHKGKARPPVESPGPARAPIDKGKARPQGLFVFGDSLVDNGNNNYLLTPARADMPPYGIDSATHLPTGRFSNGYNIPDLISQAMGKPLLLPYLSPELTGKKLLDGANFASAGVGILNDTGIQFANIVKIVDQLKDFQEYQKKVSALVGEKEKTKLIRKSLVVITLGGNDFVNNYFLLPYSPRSILHDIPSYVKLLISEYRVILMKLYEMGARRMLVTGTGPLGCVPAEMALRSRDGQCITDMNKASVLFNTQLAELLRSLNRYLGADVFIGANTHQIHMNFISKPKDFGFVSSNVACCGQGPYNGIGLCSLVSNLCTNRDEYAFWDAFHPSEMANKIIVDQILKGTREYIYPMNLSTVMHLYAMGA